MAIIAPVEPILQDFLARLPRFPLAGNIWSARHGQGGSLALCHVARERLTFFDTVQVSTAERKPFFIVDMDTLKVPCPSDDIPLPNLVIMAPTGHSHLVWILESPVFAKKGETSAPLRVWKEKQQSLTEALGGDSSYSGFTTLNPLSSKFKVAVVNRQLCKLDDFPNTTSIDPLRGKAEVVPMSMLDGVGVGYRNELLFQCIRQKAYQMRYAYRQYEAFFQDVLALSQEANERFAVALGEREVLATAKSIASWTWENLIPKRKFCLGGKTVITDEMRKKAGANPVSQKNLSARNEMVAKLASERRAVAWKLFNEGKSYKEIAEIIGGSASTVRKYVWEVKKAETPPARMDGEVDLPGLEA